MLRCRWRHVVPFSHACVVFATFVLEIMDSHIGLLGKDAVTSIKLTLMGFLPGMDALVDSHVVLKAEGFVANVAFVVAHSAVDQHVSF